MTDKYAVIGNPIAHSKSPQIHAMFAKQTVQDISYEKIEAPLNGFAATIERLRNEGYKGCNVTVPFKKEAFEYILHNYGQPTEQASTAKAANTLKFEDGIVSGDNTDGVGLLRDIEGNLCFDLRDKQVLLMGTGGAVSGTVAALREASARLTVGFRTEDKAKLIALRFSTEKNIVHIVRYLNITKQFDVVINATSSGLSDEMPPLPPNIFAPGALAYDMMYGRETPFMKFAREHGAAVVSDGLGMLVEQAAESFFIWRGVRPETAPVIVSLRMS